MRILFLDQSGKLGGAELCLVDIAQYFRSNCLVGVFADGPFPDCLSQLNIPVQILTKHILQVQKNSGLLAGIENLNRLIPLIATVTQLSRRYDLIYANTQKALVVGAISSFISRRPFVYHLHDIVSPEHFSATNRRIIVTLANRAALIVANSRSSRDAFVRVGGRSDRIHVVYNGFSTETYATYRVSRTDRDRIRHELIPIKYHHPSRPPFIVGHFSRLSPWKGQHVLLEALPRCPDNVIAVFVGDALFGEQDYVQQLQRQVKALHLEHRVKFLGFRSDIPKLMAACDLVAHTSIAPEPFGRVIIEAMLCGTPVVAADAGGATELIDSGNTGWLSPPGNSLKLADVIATCRDRPEKAKTIARQAQIQASQRFDLKSTNKTIAHLLEQIGSGRPRSERVKPQERVNRSGH